MIEESHRNRRVLWLFNSSVSCWRELKAIVRQTLPDGINVNHALVKEGWWYRKYAPAETYVRAVSIGHAGKRGLWAEPHPVPPWEWRKRSR